MNRDEGGAKSKFKNRGWKITIRIYEVGGCTECLGTSPVQVGPVVSLLHDAGTLWVNKHGSMNLPHKQSDFQP